MNKNKKNTPEQNLMKAMFGTATPTREQVEDRYYEMKANSVTEEEFKKMWGISIEEHTQRMMLFAGWLEAVSSWHQEHDNDRKYNVDRGENVFTIRQACDMAQLFYNQGREDAVNGVSEYDRLWVINKGEDIDGEE